MKKYLVFVLSFHSLIALTTLHVTQSTDNNPGGQGESSGGMYTDRGDLRYCLNQMNIGLNTSVDDYSIVFDSPMTIYLNGLLPLINNSANSSNIVIGNSDPSSIVTIDGSSSYSGFFIPNGIVTIQNMKFQSLIAQGGIGGNGISGGGGGMGAGSAIYIPRAFLNESYPSVTLRNVSIEYCSANGGNGGNGLSSSFTGEEGGGGGGGFSGNGGSITTIGTTGGGGGGGFGGSGGDVTLSTSDPLGGGGGGGGGIGSRGSTGPLLNLGSGGSDVDVGSNGNGYGLSITAGSGSSGNLGGIQAGGGGGGGGISSPGGGGGGSSGTSGQQGQGGIPSILTADVSHSGGNGGDGGGGGGGGIVKNAIGSNDIDGGGGNGGYGGGGGGGAGVGSRSLDYTVQGGLGGIGGGGGGGGVNKSGVTVANGGDSSGGGGGGGGGPSNGATSLGGNDSGKLGGGSGGIGANSMGVGFAGGGGGGGSGLGGAIFVDSGLRLTIEALPGISTYFNLSNNAVYAGLGGNGGSNAESGLNGSALGENIFLREGSSLYFQVNQLDDLLIIGDQVTFSDDQDFGGYGTDVQIRGLGKVIYGGTLTAYQGHIMINNANFQVDGLIDQTSISVCRNLGVGTQRGTLSGIGTLTGDVYVNSGIISPTSGRTLTLGSLRLNPANILTNTLGSLVHIDINSDSSSLVAVNGSASLAGSLQLNVNSNAAAGSYKILTSTGITGTFDVIEFEGTEPEYSLSYLPLESPTYVQFDLLKSPIPPPPQPSQPSVSTMGVSSNRLKMANYLNVIASSASFLGLTNQYTLLNGLSQPQYQKALGAITPTRNSVSTFAMQNVMFMFAETLDSHFTKKRLANISNNKKIVQAITPSQENDLIAGNLSPRKTIHAPAKNTNSQIWTMGFGQFSHQDTQDQIPSFEFNSGGFFVAYDYGNSDQGCIGTLAGYAHSSIQESHSEGDSSVEAGYFSIYGMRCFSEFFIDGSIWGEYMSVTQKRNISFSGFDETAKSSYHAPQLDLHFATGYDFNIKSATIEPFSALDWVLEWDPKYKEKGAYPYNMTISARKPSMLRFEAGLNGYNTATYSWGIFIFQGKLSYVFKKPFNLGRVHAAIVNAPSSFITEAFTANQNLVSPAIELFWQTKWNGFASINYNGEFGSGYTSNQFYGKIGYSF